MDERIKDAYQKIYAELFRIALLICCVSIVIKILFLNMSAISCIPEYPIMIGSPIYLMIRSRMMGVTQAETFKNRNTNTVKILFVCSILALVFFIKLTTSQSGEGMSLQTIFVFVIPFIAVFLIIRVGVCKWEEARQRKLDSQYDDENGK